VPRAVRIEELKDKRLNFLLKLPGGCASFLPGQRLCAAA
jgi:hypothetical protein